VRRTPPVAGRLIAVATGAVLAASLAGAPAPASAAVTAPCPAAIPMWYPADTPTPAPTGPSTADQPRETSLGWLAPAGLATVLVLGAGLGLRASRRTRPAALTDATPGGTTS